MKSQHQVTGLFLCRCIQMICHYRTGCNETKQILLLLLLSVAVYSSCMQTAEGFDGFHLAMLENAQISGRVPTGSDPLLSLGTSVLKPSVLRYRIQHSQKLSVFAIGFLLETYMSVIRGYAIDIRRLERNDIDTSTSLAVHSFNSALLT